MKIIDEKKEGILVSVVCAAYNHENYIEDAIKSFLMQETDFKFEILIHDDASTDNTANIIKKYEQKYPELVKPIYQKENQYSKGVRVIEILYKKAKGKYIASCEGDDYWIDKYKLQKQIDYMEKHPKCTFCFTNAIKKFVKINKEEVFIKKTRLNKKVFTLENFNIGELAEFDFIPTASFMFPKKILNNMPNFYYIPLGAGDFRLKLACTYQGYAHFINETMVVYRRGVENSVTTSWEKQNNEKNIEIFKNFIYVIDQINKETGYVYQENLDKVRIEFEIGILYLKCDKKLLENKRYLNYYKSLSLRNRIVSKLYLKHNKIYKFLKKIKDLI